jgi:hypothetical protein
VNTGLPSSITARNAGATTSKAFHSNSTYLVTTATAAEAAAAAAAAGAAGAGGGGAQEYLDSPRDSIATGVTRRRSSTTCTTAYADTTVALSSVTHLFAGLCLSGCSTSWGVQLCTWPYRMMNPCTGRVGVGV